MERLKEILICLSFFLFCFAGQAAGQAPGTIPAPVLPVGFHDVAFTPNGEAVSVQLGISDWDQGVDRAVLTFKQPGTNAIVTLGYVMTDTIYSTANTTWLTKDFTVGPGVWELRQVYAKDGIGRELNLFFVGAAYGFTVTDDRSPTCVLYFPLLQGG